MDIAVEGIVIINRLHSEQDGLITIINTEGKKISFRAKGIYKITSKNSPSCQLFVVGEYNLIYSNKNSYYTLQTGKIIKYPTHLFSNYNFTLVANIIAEIIDGMTYDENYGEPLLYQIITDTLSSLKEEYYQVLICAMIKLISILGHHLVLTNCVECGSKTGIVCFDPTSGGYICHRCKKENHPTHSVTLLRSLHKIAVSSIADSVKVKIDKEDAQLICRLLLEFLKDECGIAVAMKVIDIL